MTTTLDKSHRIDWNGIELEVKSLVVDGTAISATESAFVDGVTAGTATASKAVVLGASKEIATITSATITTLTSTTVNATTGNITDVVSPTNLTLNATSTGTIGIGSVSTGAVTITPATTITGALTPTGGVAAAGSYSVTPRNMHTGGNPPSVSTDFTDYTVVTTETIRAEIYVPANTSSTGIAVFNGSAAAGNIKAYLIDSTGAAVCATASTAQSGTDAYQRIAWASGPIALKGPATYWVAVQGDNTGGKINTHTIGNFGADKQTSTVYGTLTVATAPTTFTTALGPVASLY